MPYWDTVVALMYDKCLEYKQGELVCVVYSEDRTKRYLIIKNDKGLYEYSFEEISPYDEYEW